MKETLESALGRKLTHDESRYIEWMERQDRETQDTFAKLFADMFVAGQADANAYHIAMKQGTAR